MAGQGSAFKLISIFGISKNILNNRPLLIACQQNVGLKTSSKEKIKQLHIPDKPKRPMTPYIKYFGEQLSVVRTKDPSKTLVEVAKQCSHEWRENNVSNKEKYIDEYKKEMEVYHKKMDEFKGSLTEDQKQALKDLAKEKLKDKENRKIRKINKETNKPKRPITPYLMFAIDYAKSQNKKFSDILKVAKSKFAEMSNDDKALYEDRYVVAKKQYELELVAWETKMMKEESQIVGKQHIEKVKENTVVPKPKSNVTKKHLTNEDKVNHKERKQVVLNSSNEESVTKVIGIDSNVSQNRQESQDNAKTVDKSKDETEEDKKQKKGIFKRIFKF